MRGLRSAIRTLCVFSLPGDEGVDLARALPWFPIVGLLLGSFLFAVGFLWGLFPSSSWPSGGALLMVLLEIWMTRGLHLDGLADWADSKGALRGRERRLRIMKDKQIGAFGAIALVAALLAKWIIFERLLKAGSIIWIIPVFVLSRTVMVYFIVSLPYAREQPGMAGPFVKGASRMHVRFSLGLALMICTGFGPFGVALFVLTYMMTLVLKMRIKRSFGGITGDLLGCAGEIIQAVFLGAVALFGKGVMLYTGWSWVY